jgi:hypothetical protein
MEVQCTLVDVNFDREQLKVVQGENRYVPLSKHVIRSSHSPDRVKILFFSLKRKDCNG